MTLKQRVVNTDLLRSAFFFDDEAHLVYPFARLEDPRKYYNTAGLRSGLLRCFVTLMFTARYFNYNHVSLPTMCKILRVRGDEYTLAKQLWTSPNLAKEAKNCKSYVRLGYDIFLEKLSGKEFDMFFWLENTEVSARISRKKNQYLSPPNFDDYIHIFSGKTKTIQRQKLKSFLKNLVIKTRLFMNQCVLIMLGQIGWVSLDVLGLTEEDIQGERIFYDPSKNIQKEEPPSYHAKVDERRNANNANLLPLQAVSKGPSCRTIGPSGSRCFTSQSIQTPFEAIKDPKKHYSDPRGKKSLYRRQAYALVFTAIKSKNADLNMSVITKVLPSLRFSDLDFIKRLRKSKLFIKFAEECDNYVQVPLSIFTANITGQEWDWLLWIIKICETRMSLKATHSMPTKPGLSKYIPQFPGKTREDKAACARSFLRDLILRFQGLLPRDVLQYCIGVQWIDAHDVGIPEPIWDTYSFPVSENKQMFMESFFTLSKTDIEDMIFELDRRIMILKEEYDKQILIMKGH